MARTIVGAAAHKNTTAELRTKRKRLIPGAIVTLPNEVRFRDGRTATAFRMRFFHAKRRSSSRSTGPDSGAAFPAQALPRQPSRRRPPRPSQRLPDLHGAQRNISSQQRGRARTERV
jgi:hypothetical protein